MSVNKIKANTLTPFAAIPNDFLQNPRISIEAKGTAAFLQSLSDGFEIHPAYVRSQLGYGLRVWRKVAKELIDQGTLKLIKGGKDGGSIYEFSFYNYKQKLPLCDMKKSTKMRQSQNATVTKCDSRILSPLIKKHKTTKKQDLKNNNNEALPEMKEDVVVSLIAKIKNAIPGISHATVERLVTEYSEHMILEKLRMLEKAKPKNPTAWLIRALQNNYKPNEPNYSDDVPRETQEQAFAKAAKAAEEAYLERISEYAETSPPALILLSHARISLKQNLEPVVERSDERVCRAMAFG